MDMKNHIKSVKEGLSYELSNKNIRRTLGLTMFVVIFTFQLNAQTDTLKIINPALPENIGTIVANGQVYSSDLTGKQIQLFNALNDADAASRTATGSFVRYSSTLASSLFPGIVSLNGTIGIAEMDNSRPKYIVVASTDGAEFNFKSVYVCDVVGTEPSLKVEGFRDGVTTGSVTLSRNTATEWQKTFDPSFFPVDIFGNVDEVRFSRGTSDGFTGNLVMFNNFVIGSPDKVVAGVSTGNINKLQFYPNPVTDKLYLSGVDEDALIRITDLNGRVIKSCNLKGNFIQVDYLQEGVYSILITDNNGTKSAKFVKRNR